MILQDTREKFLANPSNKQHFINVLSETLMKLGFQIHHAKDDADCLIVKTTLDVAASSATVLIGEDTDLLVLLLYYVTDNLHGVYFMNLNDASLGPRQWGWEVNNRMLLPMLTDLPAAPEELLTVIRCNCQTGCSTTRCTCEKHGLVCTAACGHCRGETCVNVAPVNQDYEQDDKTDEEQ